jgi:hypothetical protein
MGAGGMQVIITPSVMAILFLLLCTGSAGDTGHAFAWIGAGRLQIVMLKRDTYGGYRGHRDK